MINTHFLTKLKAISPWPLILLGCWAWLYRPVFQYLATLFGREEFRTNQIVLVSVAALILFKLYKQHRSLPFNPSPRLFIPALVMALCGSLAYILVERYLDINTFSAILFGLASYGLLGLWLAPQRWWRGFPAMLLVIGVLPFGEHLETFVGYPLRTLTAGLVGDTLGALGFHSIGVDTILVFESGISQIDIPCSGVKSLWTGTLFLLAATWVENRKLGIGWLLTAAATGMFLFTANFLRVAVLALTGPALGWELIANMVHLPLGVLGFIGSCAAALVLIRRLPEWPPAGTIPESAGENYLTARPAWLSPLLTIILLSMALAYKSNTVKAEDNLEPAPLWNFDSNFQTQPAPLSAQEEEWIHQAGAQTADRYTFQWIESGQAQSSGVVMLLTSQTWRGQHRPERCFEVFGFTIQESATILAGPDFSLRGLSLTGPDNPEPVSAVYWLQSAEMTTGDFGQRIWADLQPRRERWVLVTILFDRQVDLHSPDLIQLLDTLRESVGRSLVEGGVG